MKLIKLKKRLYVPVIGWVDRGEVVGLPEKAAERLVEIRFAEPVQDANHDSEQVQKEVTQNGN